MPREVTSRYTDPLTQVWLGAARRIGLRVVRTQDAYASTNGRGTLAIGSDDSLDADDSLAQMIFHELCHSLVEGRQSFDAPDWGMDNTGPDHDWREHACLRVQWILTSRHGLRALFAPTTEFRASFWDALSGDVLADRTDRSIQAAIFALQRSDQAPWTPALSEALAATARIASDAAKFADTTTLWSSVTPEPALHPSGLPASETAGTCGTCVWRSKSRGKIVCQQAERVVVDAWPACERFERALDCQTCGACCRAAYHSVEVGRRDPVVKKQPGYIVDRGKYLEVLRDGDRCAALDGGNREGNAVTQFRCVIYDDRPKTCREFTLGSSNCLIARRRVGMSR